MATALAVTLTWSAASEVRAAEPVTHRKNAVVGTASFPIPDYGVALAYDRALGRRFSVGAMLEYAAPHPGYAHLVGLTETIGGKLWLQRPLHGLFGEVTLGVAQSMLYRAPVLHRLAIVPGIGTGFRWQFGFGLMLGASAALRFAKDVGGSPLVCTRPIVCPATRGGIYARLGLDVGWAF